MLTIGPFPATVIVVLAALAAAIGVGVSTSRRRAPGTAGRLASLVMDMTVVGFVAARLAFVAAWWQRYMDNPWSIVYISDGGFVIWVGALAALAFGAWRVRHHKALWQPLGAAVVTGWLVWAVAGGMLSLAQQSQPGLPDAQLKRLDGGTVTLAQVSDQPMVVNLWATWCPPCREEMPMLEAAQKRHPGVTFVFLNQRQSRATVRDFLRDQNLQLNHVLIDANAAVAAHVGAGALPTTLFYSADGRLVDIHVGMLTAASLAATLQQFDTAANSTATETSNET